MSNQYENQSASQARAGHSIRSLRHTWESVARRRTGVCGKGVDL